MNHKSKDLTTFIVLGSPEVFSWWKSKICEQPKKRDLVIFCLFGFFDQSNLHSRKIMGHDTKNLIFQIFFPFFKISFLLIEKKKRQLSRSNDSQKVAMLSRFFREPETPLLFNH